MISTTKKEKNKRYANLKETRDRFLNGYIDLFGNKIPQNKDVINFIQWNRYSEDQKKNCTEACDKYYKDVEGTRAYAIWKEMHEAFKKNDTAKFKELYTESRAMAIEQAEGRTELQMPKVLNPYDFLLKQSVSNYQKICKEIDELEKESRQLDADKIF